MVTNLYGNQSGLLGFPNITVPQNKYSVDFGLSAAYRLFKPMATAAGAGTICYDYLGGVVIAQGVGHATHATDPENGLNAILRANLKTIGELHGAIVAESRMGERFRLHRFTDAAYTAANYMPTGNAPTKSRKVLYFFEKWFSELGSAFNINPSLVKTAFVGIIKSSYLRLTDVQRNTLTGKGGATAADVMAKLEELWGTTAPFSYNINADYDVPMNYNEGGIPAKTKRKSKRKSYKRKKSFYY